MNKLNNLFYVLVIALLISTTFSAQQLITKRVLWSVDSGSYQQKKTLTGYVFDKDKDFSSETISVDYSTDSNYNGAVIKYTYDPDVYMTERHSYKSFSYNVPLPNREGTFTLILKFAEMYFKQGNNRVFNIQFGQERVVVGLDVAGKVGRFAAYDQYIEFDYKDGGIYFKGTLCQKAFKDNQLVVTFQKTEKDNPFVHGLLLYDGDLKQTDFYQRESFKEEWERHYKQELRQQEVEQVKQSDSKIKRKEKIKPRNDYSNDIEDDFELENIDFSDKQVQVERFSIKAFLTGGIGIIFLGGGISFFLLIVQTILISPMYQLENPSPKQTEHSSPSSDSKIEHSPSKETQKETQKDK